MLLFAAVVLCKGQELTLFSALLAVSSRQNRKQTLSLAVLVCLSRHYLTLHEIIHPILGVTERDHQLEKRGIVCENVFACVGIFVVMPQRRVHALDGLKNPVCLPQFTH